jgi:hypothetical protein
MIDAVINLKSNFDSHCDSLAKEFDKRPFLYKTALVVSHVFRAIMMHTLMSISPFFTFGIVLPFSLLYRVTVERFCAFRFTLPSLAGAAAMIFAENSLIGGFALAGYVGMVSYISHNDIENYLKSKKPCCKHT